MQHIRRHHAMRLPPKLERMFKHIYGAERAAGATEQLALRVAAATVNQYRAQHGLLIEDIGRRGWYPGKKRGRR